MKIRIWIALIAVYIAWGSTYLAIRFAVETIPPFLMAGFRFLVAGALLFAWRKAAGDTRPKKWEWRSAAIVGFFLLVGGNGGVTWAEQRVVSGVAALIVGSAPLWMVLIDALRPGGRRPNWQTALGVLVGFAGIVLLIGPGQFSSGGQQLNPAGVIVLLLSALMWAIGSLYGREAHLPSSPLFSTGMEMLAGAAGLFLLGTLTGEWSRLDLSAITPRSLWGLAYLIVFGSLVGYAAYTWLLKVAPTPLVATYAYVNPLIAIFMGFFLAQEPLTPRILVAAFVIVSAVVIINSAQRMPKKVTPPVVVLPSSGED